MSYNVFNFSFLIRCFRMDQDFSSLDLVRDHLKYCKWVHFTFSKFHISVTVILVIFEGQTSLIWKLEICLEKERGHLFSRN